MGSELFHKREIRILPAVMAGLIYCAWFLLTGGGHQICPLKGLI